MAHASLKERLQFKNNYSMENGQTRGTKMPTAFSICSLWDIYGMISAEKYVSSQQKLSAIR